MRACLYVPLFCAFLLACSGDDQGEDPIGGVGGAGGVGGSGGTGGSGADGQSGAGGQGGAGGQSGVGGVIDDAGSNAWTITFHMLVAMLIVALLIYLMHRSNSSSSIPVVSDISMRVLLVVCIAALLVQVVLGTQVREAIDRVAAEFQDRNRWISALGMEFIRHRSFSWFILAINAFFLWKLWKIEGLNRFTLTVFLLILGTMFTGAGMAWFGIPPVLQPIHLLLATVTFGVEFLLLLRMNSSVNTELN
jgi:cytochrome c oxidase assembly protein subunit 15